MVRLLLTWSTYHRKGISVAMNDRGSVYSSKRTWISTLNVIVLEALSIVKKWYGFSFRFQQIILNQLVVKSFFSWGPSFSAKKLNVCFYTYNMFWNQMKYLELHDFKQTVFKILADLQLRPLKFHVQGRTKTLSGLSARYMFTRSWSPNLSCP